MPRKRSILKLSRIPMLLRTLSVSMIVFCLSERPWSAPSSAGPSISHPIHLQASYQVLTIPRARRVHQSLLTTPFSSAWSLAVCVYHITLAPIVGGKSFADVLILNGPGTCVMLVLATYLNRASSALQATFASISILMNSFQVMGLPSPRLIYVESFARVNRLSLSGRLLHRLVDRYVTRYSLRTLIRLIVFVA